MPGGVSINRIKELREEKEIKQIELAQILNVSQSTLSNWERGIHDLDNNSLSHLASFFNCSIDYLLKYSTVRYPLDKGIPDIDETYYKICQDAKNSGISPEDLQMAVDLLKRAKNRN